MRIYSLIAAALIGCATVQEPEPQSPIEPQTPVIDVGGQSLQVEILPNKKSEQEPEPTLEEKLKWITRNITAKKHPWKKTKVTIPYVNSIPFINYGDFLVQMYNQKQNLTTTIEGDFNTERRLNKELEFYDKPHYFSIDRAHAYKVDLGHKLNPKNKCVVDMQNEVIDIIYRHSKNKKPVVKPFFQKCFEELTDF